MGRRTSPIEVPEGAPGSSTILPGVPLPSWALPAEPVQPEPPQPAPAPQPVAVGAAAPVAAGAALAAPEDWAAVLAPAPAAPAVGLAEPVVGGPAPVAPSPFDLSVPALEPLPVEAPTVPVLEPAAVEALAVPALEPLPAPDPAAAPVLATAPLAAAAAYAEPEQVPRSHRHAGAPDDAQPATAKRRLLGRRKAAEAAADEAGPEAPAVVTVDAAPLDLPAPALQSAPVDLPAPTGLPAPASAPLDLPAPGAVDEPAAPGRSRRPLVLLGAVGGVAVLGVVAAFVWPGLLVSAPDDETAAPVAPRSSASAPANAGSVTLQAPAAIGALTLDSAASAASTQGLAAAVLPGLTAPVSAVYSAAGVPAATVVAWTSSAPLGATAITGAFAGYESTTKTAVSGIAPVAAGALGGQMSCGTSTVAGQPASVCFWADSASFGSVTVLKPASPAAGAETAAQVRQGVEKKG